MVSASGPRVAYFESARAFTSAPGFVGAGEPRGAHGPSGFVTDNNDGLRSVTYTIDGRHTGQWSFVGQVSSDGKRQTRTAAVLELLFSPEV